MRLLIVEDEEDMREALCYGLRRRGYAVDAAGDGADAVEQCGINEFYRAGGKERPACERPAIPAGTAGLYALGTSGGCGSSDRG